MVGNGLNSIANLQKVFDEFADLQKEHVTLLMADNLKTLIEWTAKRQQLEGRLRACLDSFDFGSIAADSELAVMIQESFKMIMKEDETLAGLVKNRRGEVGEKLRTLRKGKVALNCYSLYRSAGPKPKYLNSRA